MIGKRQTATPCDGGNCGINDDIIPTTFTGDNPLMEGQNVFSDPEDPSEVLTNAVSRSQIDGSANNDVADKPDVSGDSSSGNTAEGDVAPDKADTNSLEAVPDVSTVAVRQRLGDGRPIDGYPLDGCYEGPDDAYAVHRMEFLNYPEDSQWRRRNHWAILVSDLVLPLDLRYDVTPRGGKLAYQKLPAIFMRKNEIVEIGHYDFRGWLVATEGKTKEDALRWFEGIASNPTLLARASARDRVGEHITSWWTIQVLSTMDIYAMDGTQPAYWVRWT